MNFDNLSDEDLDMLRTVSKRITNPGARWSEKPGHRQRNFTVKSDGHEYVLYQRQSLNDEEAFSCGLLVIKPDGTKLTLCRYNGGNHAHGDIEYRCHIHKTTAQALNSGRKPEREADETDRFATLEGATYCAMLDCMITGLSDIKPDQPGLFRS